MKTNKVHFTTDEILLYLEDPDSNKFQHFREHLIYCENCLKTTHEISRLEFVLRNGDFTVTQRKMQISLISKWVYHSSLFKLIFHFFQRNVLLLSTSSATIILFIGLSSIYNNPKTILISSYQNSPYITYHQDKKPGMGFFTSNHVNKVPYAVARFKWNEEILSVSWDKIKSVNNYLFTIESSVNNKKEIVARLSSSTNAIEIEDMNFFPHINYQYTISGRTQTGLVFTSTGGFIF